MTDTVTASHILVHTQEDAIAIKNKLLEGADFSELAKGSMCPSGASGGVLGTFGRGAMVPEFEAAAFALDINEVSDPIQTPFGWHIIYRSG